MDKNKYYVVQMHLHPDSEEAAFLKNFSGKKRSEFLKALIRDYMRKNQIPETFGAGTADYLISLAGPMPEKPKKKAKIPIGTPLQKLKQPKTEEKEEKQDQKMEDMPPIFKSIDDDEY